MKKENRFDMNYNTSVTYTLTASDLKFLKEGQPIQVIVCDRCMLFLHPPKEKNET